MKRVWLYASLASLGVSLPTSAWAQDGGSSSGNGPQITINPVINRYYPGGTDTKLYPFRSANMNPNDINFQDCNDNIVLQFNLSISGLPTTDEIQVWAGTTDCSQSSAREPGVGPYCWQVAPPGTFGNSMQEYGNIYARNITRFIGTTTADNEFDPIGTVPGPEACHTQTTSGAVQLTLYFLYMPPGVGSGGTPDSYVTYGQNVDMVGPEAPTLNLPVGIGDGLLLISWTPQIDSTIQGFQIFAQDQGPSGLGLGEAGAATPVTPIYCHSGNSGTTTCIDAGTGDGSVDAQSLDACTTTDPDGSAYTEVADASAYVNLSDTDLAAMGCQRGAPVDKVTVQTGTATCTSDVLVDLFTANVTASISGEGGIEEGGSAIGVTTTEGGTGTSNVGISEIDAAVYGVGNVGGNTTSSYTITSARLPDGTTGPLINGHQYAIAVAAYDDDGNVGALSNLGCQTPAPVTDFWDKFSEDGGLAGGGFCTLQAPGAPTLGSLVGFGVGMTLVTYGRRRRRRRS
jgi:hypothetical protein